MENSMFTDVYFVPKASGTYADVFMAYGFARLMERLLLEVKRGDPTASIRVSIEDAGPYFVIRLSEPFREEFLGKIEFPADLVPFISSKKFPAPSGAVPSRDVDEVWEGVRFYNEQRNALYDKNLKASEIKEQLSDFEPPHDWQIVVCLGDWRMQAQDIYNRIVAQWQKSERLWREHVRIILKLMTTIGIRNEILEKWKKDVKKQGIQVEDTASQLLSPHQGKGQNETKSRSLRMDNIKDRPWLEEFLKTVGLWSCMMPRQIINNDWKIYVISPKNILLSQNREVYRRLSRYIWQERRRDTTSLKTDITSILLFYKAWLDYVEIALDERDDFDAELARPENVVTGFYTVQFKRLSQNAYTMLNQSFLHLPEWGRAIQTREDVTLVKQMIDEHLEVIRSIEEEHSNGYDLLRLYRDFVAGENWKAFFDFISAFAQDVMRRMNQNQQYVPLFSVPHLRRLIMTQKKFSKILEREGFQNVAYAIRHSTIIPQGRKAKGQDYLYEIRYGLGAEFKRKSTVKEEFLTALSDFMQSYNQENAQTLENTGKQMRKDLRTSDIQDVVELVDEFGSEVVANLLIAYGYAREPREDETASQP